MPYRGTEDIARAGPAYHGFCRPKVKSNGEARDAAGPWINNYDDSMTAYGGYLNGAMHPNVYGYMAYRERALPVLRDMLK